MCSILLAFLMFKPTFLVPHPWVPWTDPVPSRLVAVEWTGGRRAQRKRWPEDPQLCLTQMLHVWYQNIWLVGGLEMFGTFSHIYWDVIIPTD